MYGSYRIDGDKLRRLRVKLALSQQDLERMTNITQSTISNLEQGNRPARLSTIRNLAAVGLALPRLHGLFAFKPQRLLSV